MGVAWDAFLTFFCPVLASCSARDLLLSHRLESVWHTIRAGSRSLCFFCRFDFYASSAPASRARTIIQFQPCFDGFATMMATMVATMIAG